MNKRMDLNYQETLDKWVKEDKVKNNKEKIKLTIKEFEQKILDTLLTFKLFSKTSLKKLWHEVAVKNFNNNKVNYGRNEFAKALENLKQKGFINIYAKDIDYIVITLFYYPFKADAKKTFKGKIFVKTYGGEILKDKDTERLYFVHSSELNGALNLDEVEFQYLDTSSYGEKLYRDQLQYVIVTKVLKHEKEFYSCTISLIEEKLVVVPDDKRLYLPIILDDYSELKEGQKILVKITQFTKNVLYGTVSRIIGDKTTLGADILAAVLDKGVVPEFSQDVLNAANELKLEVDNYQKKLRKDLTSLPICTIDPASSKDFDDAIYVKKLDNGNYRLIVCIADVAHYVRQGSILNDVAIERGTSIYLADRVIPMLPPILSDDLCSLNYNVIRLTLTADMEIDVHGKIVKYDVYPSYIKSHRRFSYDEVNDFFNDKSSLSSDKKDVILMLKDARELHFILDKAKTKRGYVKFHINEPLIVLDEKGIAVDIKLRKTGEAQEMIEDFMVSANEVVTLFAKKHKLNFIYRVHDQPSLEKLTNLKIEAKKLNFKIDSDLSELEPKDLNRWLENNKDNPNQELINLLILRTMAKAEYKTKNIGHFGLALKNYTHFTSPIRRLSDLIVGQIFWMNVFDRKSYSDQQRNNLKASLNKLCDICVNTEITAIECERDVNSMKFAEYMEQHLNDEYVGYVSGVMKYGLYVELDNTINGLISMRNLFSKDFFVFDQENKIITNRHRSIVFSLGTKVKIKVLASNKNTRQIDFGFVELVK